MVESLLTLCNARYHSACISNDSPSGSSCSHILRFSRPNATGIQEEIKLPIHWHGFRQAFLFPGFSQIRFDIASPFHVQQSLTCIMKHLIDYCGTRDGTCALGNLPFRRSFCHTAILQITRHVVLISVTAQVLLRYIIKKNL